MKSQSKPLDEAGIASANISHTMAAGRYPKRTRTQVKYCEIDPEESESESEDDAEDCPPPSKRVKVFWSSKPRPKNKIFPFMSLPAELRNKIYHECLVSDQVDKQGRPSFYFVACNRRYRHTVTRCNGIEAVDFTRDRDYGRSNGIYGYHNHRTHDDDDASTESCDEIKPLNTNFLASCKAIYTEAAQLLYQQRFIFYDSMALISFMSECTPQAAALIRHIEVIRWMQTRSRKNEGFLAMSILAVKGCINLQSLVISGGLGSMCSYTWRPKGRAMEIHDRVARKVYRAFYPWLETVGRAKGNRYEGLKVLDIGNATWRGTSAHPKLDNGEEEKSLKAAYEKSLKKLIRTNWL